MASNDVNYGVQLPDVQDTARTISAPAANSSTATALESLAKGVSSFSNYWQEQSARKRQAGADARAAEDQAMQRTTFNQSQSDRAAANDTVLGLSAINAGDGNKLLGLDNGAWNNAFSVNVDTNPDNTTSFSDMPGNTTDTLTPAALKDIDSGAAKIASMSAAVDQGKMPDISKTAMIDLLANKLFAKYPGSASAIAQSLKDRGVDSALFDELTAETDKAASDRKTQLAARDTAIKSATENLGPAAMDKTPEELYQIGLGYEKRDNDLKYTTNLAQAQSTNINSQISQSNFTDKQVNNQYGVDAYKNVTAVLAPFAKSMQELVLTAGEPGANGAAREARLHSIASVARVKAQNYIENYLNRGGFTDPAAREQARKGLMDYVDSTFIQPLTTRDSAFAGAADVMGKKFGMDTSVAYPFLSDMKRFGISPGDIPDIMNNLPPSLVAGLKNELNGLQKTGINQNLSTMHLLTISRILKGDTTLNDIGDATTRQNVIATSWRYAQSNAAKVAAGTGNTDMWAHTYRSLIVASEGFNANSDDATLASASQGLFGPGQQGAIARMISQPGTSEDGKIIAKGSRASAAVILSATRSKILNQWQRRGEAGASAWTVAINPDGRYDIIKNDKWKPSKSLDLTNPAFDSSNPGSIAFAGDLKESVARPPITGALRRLVATANIAGDYLTTTGAWDTDAPKGTDREVRRFWNTGGRELTPDMQKKQEQGKLNTPSWDSMANAFEKDLQNTPDVLTSDTGNGSRADRNNNPGNIIDSGFAKSQPGYKGSDGKFAIFETAEHGKAAQASLLTNRYINKGYNTVAKIVNRWAPPASAGGDNSQASVDNYIAYVSRRLNINPNDTITPVMASRIADAMHEFESGKTQG